MPLFPRFSSSCPFPEQLPSFPAGMCNSAAVTWCGAHLSAVTESKSREFHQLPSTGCWAPAPLTLALLSLPAGGGAGLCCSAQAPDPALPKPMDGLCSSRALGDSGYTCPHHSPAALLGLKNDGQVWKNAPLHPLSSLL